MLQRLGGSRTRLFSSCARLANAAAPRKPIANEQAGANTQERSHMVTEIHPDFVQEYEAISGAPSELCIDRTVRIYQEAKSATQSGDWNTRVWRLDWDVVPRANKWENDLMGWSSSGDYMQATQMKFRSKEDAVKFALNQGWNSLVIEPNQRDFKKKEYANNFLYSPTKLKHIRTK